MLDKTGYYRYGLVQQDFDLWLRILNYTSVYVLQEKLDMVSAVRQKRKIYRITGDKGKEKSSVS